MAFFLCTARVRGISSAGGVPSPKGRVDEPRKTANCGCPDGGVVPGAKARETMAKSPSTGKSAE